MLMVILTKMKSVRSYIDMRFFRLRIYRRSIRYR